MKPIEDDSAQYSPATWKEEEIFRAYLTEYKQSWNKTFKINIFLIQKVETSNGSKDEARVVCILSIIFIIIKWTASLNIFISVFVSIRFLSRFSNYTLSSYFLRSWVSRKVCFLLHSCPPTLRLWFLPALNAARSTAVKRSSPRNINGINVFRCRFYDHLDKTQNIPHPSQPQPQGL